MRSSRTVVRLFAWTLIAGAAWCSFFASRTKSLLTNSATRHSLRSPYAADRYLLWPIAAEDRRKLERRTELVEYSKVRWGDSFFRKLDPHAHWLRTRGYGEILPGVYVPVEMLYWQPQNKSQQYRCETALVQLLHNSPDVATRAAAAQRLHFPQSDRVRAELKRALKDEMPVRIAAVYALSAAKEPGLAETIFEVFWEEMPDQQRGNFLAYLLRNTTKRDIPRLLDILERIEKEHPSLMASTFIDPQSAVGSLLYAGREWSGSIPQSAHEWRRYWERRQAWFDESMQRTVRRIDRYAPDELETDSQKLKFTAAIDSNTYRVREPIRLELSLSNQSDRPIYTVPPKFVDSADEFGVHLERIGETIEVLHHVPPRLRKPGGMIGSFVTYSPQMEIIPAGGTTIDESNLRDWLAWRGPHLWPLAEGRYELTLTLDLPPLAPYLRGPYEAIASRAIRPHGTVTVEFTVAGAALEDPAECLRVVERKCRRRISPDALFNRDDLQNMNPYGDRSERGRRELDRRNLALWGDDRLAPLFPMYPKNVDSQMRESWSGESSLVLPYERSKLTCWIK